MRYSVRLIPADWTMDGRQQHLLFSTLLPLGVTLFPQWTMVIVASHKALKQLLDGIF